MDSIDYYDKRNNRSKKKGLEEEWADLKKSRSQAVPVERKPEPPSAESPKSSEKKS